MNSAESRMRFPEHGTPRWPRLTEKIKAALECASADSYIVSYLPWTGSPEEIKADVKRLASEVDVVLLDEPPVTEGDGAIVYLAHLIEALAGRAPHLEKSGKLAEAKQALETLPPSPALLKCAQARLHAIIKDEKKFMVAALTAGSETCKWLSWLLEALNAMQASRVVVVGAAPTSVDAEVIRLTLQEMYEDLRCIAKGAVLWSPTAPSYARTPPSGSGGTSKRWWLKWRPGRRRNDIESSEGFGCEPPAEVPRYGEWAKLFAPEQRNDRDDWACWQRTIIRLAHPNLSLADQLLHRVFKEVDEKVNYLTSKGLPANQAEAPMQLRKANSEERRDLRNRLRFIATLDKFRPNLIRAIRHELDGADQFYRLLLILGGWTAQDSLLASALLPPWHKYLDDYVFCELVRSMFRAEDGCGVKRFESRSQLFWLTCWNVPTQEAATTSESLALEWMNKFTDWVAQIGQHTGGTPEDDLWLKGQLTQPDFPSQSLRQRTQHAHTRNAAELLQIAQMLLSVDELLGRSENDEYIDELITEAINSSRGAIHIDATLIKARALAVRSDDERADRTRAKALLREIARHGDFLARIAVEVEGAFMFERRGDYWEAIRRYEKALKDAELVAADELSSRAMLGWLRCDTLTSALPSRRSPAVSMGLRARCMVQIQSARAPDLFPGIGSDDLKLFLSYRSDTKSFSKGLYNKLEPANVPLAPWRDDEALDKTERDFGATIHRELLGCNAIVLALCPTFFESPWCVHELHFALGQHEVRGIHLFWTWCANGTSSPPSNSSRKESPADDSRLDTPINAARSWIGLDENTSATYGHSDYHRFHERDRILRVIEHGECLTDHVVRSENLEEAVTSAAITVCRAIPHIRRQAGLEPVPHPKGGWESLIT